ncbi:acyl-CoA thioesterase [Zhihengliuella salsuginis]|uniref:Acyl-CoA thioesterase II n=1 Tax=Zhihengliuella salsuginis TaxID=578222 RepID=A0ABQ3GJ67_9MICC|nr:acyl-CoA thioesterase domain-containing protein [Zhihengliuella salsuginis]GHD07966.1 acyl-CoA thioesterase II [Zhihengliuella salsuginis]
MNQVTSPLTSDTFVAATALREVGAEVYDLAFEATTQYVPWPKAYGGDMVAQGTTAMMRSVGSDRTLHSMHSYFMRPVDIGAPVRYEVEKLRDGRGYSTRHVRAFQNGKPVYVSMGSFHVPEDGPEFASTAPAAVDGLAPESVRSAAEALDGVDTDAARYWSAGRSFDMRHVPSPVYLEVDGEQVGHQAVWIKAFTPLDDDAVAGLGADDAHRVALAYVCDYTILESILRAHGAPWATEGLATASLDHSMWFHRPGRLDDWVLYAQEAVSSQNNRGLATGRFFDRSGRLLATVAQEGMVRLPH